MRDAEPPWGALTVRRWTVGLVVAAALLGACTSAHGPSTTSDGRIKVVAAFYPVAEAVARVGGRRVAVDDLTPAGAEPHDLELIPDEVDAIQDAKVVFVMGHGFQPTVEKTAAQRAGATVELLDHLPIDSTGRTVAAEGAATTLDPHVWLDPTLYADLVTAVEHELVKVDPAGGAQYARNAARFRGEILDVGARYRAGLDHCARHTIVTSHEAFGYLARRYGLTQEGITGLSADEEPNAQRLADLADLVRREKIRVVFTEDLVSRRVADALAREAGGVETEVLSPLESLTRAQVDHGADWASVMGVNLRKLRAALGCR